MKIYLVACGLPGLLICVCIPMALGMVPPNGFYGFRTEKTLSSPKVWYPANRACGWFMIAGELLAIGFSLFLLRMHPDWPARRLMLWMANATPASLLLSVAASFIYLRHL
ncbi:MAG TPA: SdpI family protein [Bryobacteraceae bacterium]|nr:SdpI family protein [Bryobacteraceae bacterium]